MQETYTQTTSTLHEPIDAQIAQVSTSIDFSREIYKVYA
jgi:hypothetical protein